MAQQRAADSSFGALLRGHRLAAGLTQEALAERARMSVEGIGALERGHRQSPYRATVELLATALQLAPAAAAELVAAATRAPRRAQPRDRGRPHASAHDRAMTNLPFLPSRFLGRARELAELNALLEAHRIVTIIGTGGIGKTRAALEAAAAFADRRDDGVWFANFAPLNDAALVSSTVASALGLRIPGGGAGVASLVAAARRLDALIVLDNCEHVIGGAAEVAEALVLACPRVRLLVTSREPLNISGERVYRLPSLEVPPAQMVVTAADSAAYSAVALFADRARAGDDAFVITDATAATVGSIARRLDGIPLAIELAAARVRSLGLQRLAERLDERFALLTTGSRTALARHQTLRAAFDWGHELLTDAERAVFARLAVFSGGWTLDAAEQVCADERLTAVEVLDVLGSLVDKSLVVADDGANGDIRYRLLESSRAYAREKLAELGQHTIVAGRHARWVRAFVAQADTTFAVESLPRWLANVEPEAENVRAALTWAARSGDHVLVGQVTASFLGFWLEHAQSEGRRWVEAALAQLDAAEHPAIVARLWLAESYFADGNSGIEAAREAIALLDARTNPATLARAYYALTVGMLQTARFAQAAAAAARTLELYEQAGLSRTRWYAHALSARGMAELAQDRLVETRASYEASLAVSESLGDEQEAARARTNLASLLFSDGDASGALELVLQVRRVPGLTAFVEGQALMSSAVYLIALGDAAQAQSAAHAALLIFRRVQQPYMAVNAILHVAAALALQGESEQSARLFGFVSAWIVAEGCEWESAAARSSALLTTTLQAQLRPGMLATLRAAGARLEHDHAVDEALAASQSPRTN